MLVGVNLFKRKNIKFFFELPETRLEKKLDNLYASAEIISVSIVGDEIALLTCQLGAVIKRIANYWDRTALAC